MCWAAYDTQIDTSYSSSVGTCHCGATGCLETEVAQSRLFDLAGLSGGDAAQPEEALTKNTTAEVAEEVARQLDYLGIALRNAVNIFNPEAIVLDGFLGVLHSLSPGTLENQLLSQALDGPASQVRIYRAELGTDLMMLGAAELAFTQFLANPLSIGALPVPATHTHEPSRR